MSVNRLAPRGRRRTRSILAALLAVLLALGVVSTVLVAHHHAHVAAQHRREAAARYAAARKEAARAKAQHDAARKEEARVAAATAAFHNCSTELSPLMDALSTVDARLDVGLSERQLSDMVGKASVAYHRIDVDRLGTGRCLVTGAKLEGALNAYTTSVRKWNACIFDFSCDEDAIDPALQAKWQTASKAIDRAKDLLATLDPSDPSYKPEQAADANS